MAGLSGGGMIYVAVGSEESFDLKVRQLATWGVMISDLSEPMEQIGEDLQADFAQNVASEGGLFGAWPSLAPSTVRERERLGYGGAHPMLWRTGELAHSLSDRGAPGNYFQVTPTSVQVGTTLQKGLYHQRGTWNMPARKIIGVTWTRRALIVRRIGDYVRETVARAGLGA